VQFDPQILHVVQRLPQSVLRFRPLPASLVG
jgi:hypothetical protein